MKFGWWQKKRKAVPAEANLRGLRANIVYMMLGVERQPDVQLELQPGATHPSIDSMQPLQDLCAVYAASITELLTDYRHKKDRELRDQIAQAAQTHDVILCYLHRMGYRLPGDQKDEVEDFDRLEAESEWQ